MSTKRSLALVLLILVLALLTALTVQAAGDPITELTYTPFQDVPIRASPSANAKVLATAKADQEYEVVTYEWSPSTSMNSWACIKYRSNKKCGWSPVQIGYVVYAQVVFELGILGGQ